MRLFFAADAFAFGAGNVARRQYYKVQKIASANQSAVMNGFMSRVLSMQITTLENTLTQQFFRPRETS